MAQRIKQIDLLRGVSILLVLAHHLDRGKMEADTFSGKLLHGLSSGGWIGVDLFFVLSGFLVSGLIFKEIRATGGFNAWRFLGRRGFKIYPAFYLMLLFSLPALGWLGKEASSTQFLAEAFFIQNYLPHLWSHTWSLAVEEQFYLLLCAGFAGAIASGRGTAALRRIPLTVALLCAALFGARLASHASLPFDIKSHYMASHLRMDGLFFGVGLSYFAAFHGERLQALARRHRAWLLAGGVLLMLPCFLKGFGGWHVYSFGLTFLYLGAGTVLLAALGTPDRSPWLHSLPARALATIGLHSYSIYLWHILVKEGVARLGLAPALEHGTFALGALAFGILMAKTVEWPLLRLRDRILPSAETSAVAVY